MIANKKRRDEKIADDYLELIRRFPLRPIRNAADYEAAARILAGLVGRADAGLTPGESDYADVLGRLVEDYDKQHSSILKDFAAGRGPSPIEMLKYLMEEHGMNTIALGKLVGGSGQASMILNGKRELSKANIRTLAGRFNVSPAVFI
jgi:HTH-type transcriptional regulator/antitoxin HigA